jgi:hypothetical protein
MLIRMPSSRLKSPRQLQNCPLRDQQALVPCPLLPILAQPALAATPEKLTKSVLSISGAAGVADNYTTPLQHSLAGSLPRSGKWLAYRNPGEEQRCTRAAALRRLACSHPRAEQSSRTTPRHGWPMQ